MGHHLIRGNEYKTALDEDGNHLSTGVQRGVPWIAITPVVNAIRVLERMVPDGALLFDAAAHNVSEQRSPAAGAITNTTLRDRIEVLVAWANECAAAHGLDHEVIPPDRHGAIGTMRFRRTLAWHIVRRPGGTVAGATQYGHLRTQITHGYAGGADSGFLDEITFEEFLLRAEALHEDHQRLLDGEHVSGPAADTYQTRLLAARRFAGLTITTPAQVNHALASPDLQVHHGALLTCVYRPATAACRQNNQTDNAPAWSRCRLTCRNVAHTDRDIANLRQHIRRLKSDLASSGIPQPLRQRIQQRVDEHERAITAHDTTRPQPPAQQPPGYLS